MTSGNETPVHVLHIIGVLDRGGAETVALDLCRAIPSSVVHQTFLCLGGRPGDLANEFEAAGATVIPMRLHSVGFLVRFVALLRRGGFDSIVAHVSLASAPMLLVARVFGVRQRIARIHSEGDGRSSRLRRPYRWAMRRMLLLSATHVLGVTRESLNFALDGLPARAERRGLIAEVLYNGVDTRRFQYAGYAPESLLRVVHIGRAAPEKNRQSLASMKKEVDRCQSSRFTLYGSLGMEDIPSPDGLVLGGLVSDVPSVLQESDVLVLPSLREGLPGVVLEALATGVPVVASDLPGLREIRDQTPGLTLVAPSAPAGEWATALIAAGAIGDSMRSDIGAAFRSGPFALDTSASRWAAIWTLSRAGSAEGSHSTEG